MSKIEKFPFDKSHIVQLGLMLNTKIALSEYHKPPPETCQWDLGIEGFVGLFYAKELRTPLPPPHCTYPYPFVRGGVKILI